MYWRHIVSWRNIEVAYKATKMQKAEQRKLATKEISHKDAQNSQDFQIINACRADRQMPVWRIG
jgi:hypothetical protein